MVVAESVEKLLDDADQEDEGDGGIGYDRPYKHREQGEEDGIDQDGRAAIAVTRFRGDVLQPRIEPEIPVPPEKRRVCAQLGFRECVMSLTKSPGKRFCHTPRERTNDPDEAPGVHGGPGVGGQFFVKGAGVALLASGSIHVALEHRPVDGKQLSDRCTHCQGDAIAMAAEPAQAPHEVLALARG